MKSYIYQIKNLVSGKVYIGQTINLGPRRRQHWYDLRHGIHGNDKLQKSFNKHGEENFIFEVIVSVIDSKQENIDALEILKISEVPIELRYNLSLGGGAFMKGRNHTPEVRAKMSETRKGKKHTSEAIQRMKENRSGSCLGERNSHTKLTVEQVKEIKFKHLKEKTLTNKEIGQIYGVNWRTISQIKTGKNWGYLLEDTVEAVELPQGG